MDNNLLYWIIEFVKVLFGYGFLMIVWPSAVFRKYLKGKSVTFRFGFCVSVQVVLVSTVVLMLGLIGILNKWTMCIFFYGALIWSFREHLKLTEERRRKFKYLVTGTFGMKHFLLLCKNKVVGLLKRAWNAFWGFYKKHWLEYSLLVIILVYGVIYFSYGAFQEKSYGFSDISVHHSWIYQLAQGNVFSSGIYPEGMHCVIYALYALFGIRLYSCLLFIGGINIIATILSIYCLAKEVFHWRYSSIFTLIILFTVKMNCMNQITAMARLQCALPQEFGFPALYLCAAFLIRFLKHKNFVNRNGKQSKMCWDGDLFLFCMSLAVTIIVHFYVTIMAFFLCLGIAIVYIGKILRKTHFVPLVTAAILGVLIAATPMVVGYITGIPLQGSLYWGMSVIQGGSSSDSEVEIETESPNIQSDVSEENQTSVIQVPTSNMQSQIDVQEQVSAKEPTFSEKIKLKMDYIVLKGKGVVEQLKVKGTTLYRNGFLVLFQEQQSRLIIGLSMIIVIFWLIYRIISGLLSLVLKRKKINCECFDGYPMMVLSAIIFVIAYTAPSLGLPSLVEGSRTCFIGYSLVAMVFVMLIDIVLTLFSCFIPRVLISGLSLAVSVGLFLLIYSTGYYHGYLYFELTRYSSVVDVTNSIIDSLPENTYTIVSPTDELYQVIEYGRHEEWLTFLENQRMYRYTIPTDYVFLFVEKKALKYVQWHYFGGPDWLANNSYSDMMPASSRYPQYRFSEISHEYADSDIMHYGNLSGSYTSLESRTIIESKAHKWCTQFEELYPQDMKIYYEDDYFVCYYFKQNVHHLYDLSID